MRLSFTKSLAAGIVSVIRVDGLAVVLVCVIIALWFTLRASPGQRSDANNNATNEKQPPQPLTLAKEKPPQLRPKNADKNAEQRIPSKTGPDDTSQQAQPEPRKHAVGLRDAISLGGFSSTADLTRHLPAFVQFGTRQAADAYARGDQFDRLEIKKKADLRRTELRKELFRLDKLKFTIANRDDVETRGLVAELHLPLRVRGKKPFYVDALSFSGSLLTMHPSELDATRYVFLTKQGTLLNCSAAEAAIVARNNGVLYHPEKINTTLILIFNGDLDDLKNITRSAKDLSVEIEISELTWDRPLSWGYFRRDAWLKANWDCEKLLIDNFFDDPQPDYFTTIFGNEGELKAPEIVHATLVSLKALDKEGKVIGGYRISK